MLISIILLSAVIFMPMIIRENKQPQEITKEDKEEIKMIVQEYYRAVEHQNGIIALNYSYWGNHE